MPDHPSDADLRAYGLGRLDDARAAGVATHLAACPGCRRRASEASSDSFLGRLRDARGASPEAPAPPPPAAAASTSGGRPVAAPPSDSLPPGLADHPDYRIVRELGRGGMGVVYLAHNTIMGRDEVLKIISAHILERPGVFDRFQREIRAVARLHHRNIVTAYSAFRLGGGLVFAMEYVPGMDLARLIKVKGPLPVRHAAFFAQQAAQGLQHAHERGMVHRDIKPHNLMLTHDGELRVVKILDFGLAKATREGNVDGALTQSDQALGTPDYIAPEQILNATGVDVRADVYSLGCTLYFFLTGRPPFRANSLYDLYQAHISRDADPLNRLRPDVPSGLAALAGKMMAKDPADRFQTPAEVAQALAPYLKKGAAEDRPPQGAPRPAAADPVVDLTLDDRPLSIPAAPAPARPASEKPAPPEAEWTSLIDFRQTEPAGRSATPPPAPLPALAAARRKLPPRATAIGLGTLGAFLVLSLIAWQIFVKTPYGTIEFDDLPKDAVVTIDGAKVDVSWTEGGAGQISVAAGPHGLEVRQGGVKIHGDRVTVDAGKPFTIRLERPAATAAPAEVANVKNETNPWPAAATLRGHSIGPHDMAQSLSPDLRWMVIRGPENLIRRQSAPGETDPLPLFAYGKEWMWTTEFSPDGKSVAGVANDNLVRIWDVASGSQVRELRGHSLGVISAAYSRDGKRIASTSFDRSIRIWDLAEGSPPAVLSGHTDAVWCAAFSPDGKRLASGQGNLTETAKVPGLGKLLLWDLEAGTCSTLDDGEMRVAAVAFSPDGKRLASCSYDKTVRVWDVQSRRCLATLGSRNDMPVALAYSPDGRLLAEASRENLVRVWDAIDHSLITTLTGASGGFLNFLRFSPAGDWIYTGGSSLKAWKTPSPELKDSLPNPPPPAEHPVAADGFTSLFNGRDLSGWRQNPSQQGQWTVVDGSLVGSATGMSHLYSERGDYKDFHLRLRARINDGGNSGVFIRASNAPVMPQGSPRWPSGYEAQINSSHADPNRTGSLYALGKAFSGGPAAPPKPDDWFDMEVVARGNHIVVNVDGETRVDFIDAQRVAASGHLALQVHDARSRVEFQKIEIKELKDDAPAAPADGFTPLFNRWDLGGWKVQPERSGDWRVEGGVIVGTSSGPSYLYTTRGDYKDFELRFEARAKDGGNNGVFFRASGDLKPNWPAGYEAQIDCSPNHGVKTGSLFRSPEGSHATDTAPSVVSEALSRPDDWFKMEVVVRGPHFVVRVNGRTTTDYVDPNPVADSGYIAFQVYDAQSRLELRNVEIKELDAEKPPAPPADDGFTPLFNGRDKSGWKTHPSQPGDWRVENGLLVGTAAGTSHLYTDRGDYKDFELRLKARIYEGGNSGVLFRASDVPRPQWPQGYEAQIYTGKGPQTGSLYRGAGDPTVITMPMASPSGLTKPEDWFDMNVVVRGSHVVIKVNGQSAVDFVDPHHLASRGHIALQANGAQTRVEFWSVDIKELSSEPEPAPAPRAGFSRIFNGTDLKGWKVDRGDPRSWRAEGGALVSRGGADYRAQTFLLSDRDYSDFTLRFEFQIPKGGDGGVVFRAEPGESPSPPEINLRNVAADASAASTAAFRWRRSGTGSHYLPPDRPANLKPDGWNSMEVEVRGDRLKVAINGAPLQSVDLAALAARPDALAGLARRAGRLGFQSHTGTVRFRNIEIQEDPVVAAWPADAREFRGARYKLFAEKRAWHQAEQECRRLGGRLAVVRDAAQDAFLHGLVREARAEAAWLGATDERHEGRWTWVDGSLMTYANWSPTQPNNKGDGEHYLVLIDEFQGQPFEGRWSDQPDVPVQHSPGFLCEWPAAGAK